MKVSEWKVIKEMIVNRQSKFDGKKYVSIDLYDVFMGKEGDSILDKRPNITVEFNDEKYFNPLIGTFRKEEIPEIDSFYYKNGTPMYHVEDESLKQKILYIINEKSSNI